MMPVKGKPIPEIPSWAHTVMLLVAALGLVWLTAPGPFAGFIVVLMFIWMVWTWIVALRRFLRFLVTRYNYDARNDRKKETIKDALKEFKEEELR